MYRTTFLLCFVQTVLSATIENVAFEYKSAEEPVNYRLPTDAVRVQTYTIALELENNVFETNQFNGLTDIIFTNLKRTNQIILHANKIAIASVSLETEDGTSIDIEQDGFLSDNVTDFLTLNSVTPLEANQVYMLKFVYTAELRTKEMYGLYKSSYTTADGTVRNLATTQFQSTHARKAFPCFDEPSFKAEFHISIKHPKPYRAVSNALETITDIDNIYALTKFEKTPRMPTYLVAFIISDFECTESRLPIENNLPHRVCSRTEAKDTQELALTMGPNLTWAMEKYTDTKYSRSTLTKLDQFAIPDFADGAMENWGLITYRETALLWDPVESSNRYKQRVITVIAHELAHLWFGDLVTTHWWSDTFLNEGFATYFEYYAVHEVDPSLELDKQFVIEQLQAVLVSDAAEKSAPLSYEVSSPAQISQRFSAISYNKGGSIFRMVRYFMGIENFKRGLKKYLADNIFGNTKPEDLWTALSPHTTGLPGTTNLGQVMQNWVNKGGYPILTVTTSGLDVTVTQKRFLSSGTPNEQDLWFVPVTYTTQSDTNKFQDTISTTWFQMQSSLNLRSALKQESDWIILNNQQIGYYRVDYDNNMWTKIKLALLKPGFDGIHELNRAQLVDDMFNMARYNYRTFSEVLDLYKFLKTDTSYYSWYSAMTAFSNMLARTTNVKVTENLSNYLLDLSQLLYNSVPFNLAKDHDQIYTHKKVLIVPWACKLGLQNCIDNALAAFEAYKTTQKRPDKNLRSAIYCNGLRYSKDISNDWDFLWKQFQSTRLATEQITILSALGCTTDKNILKNYLLKSINATSGIRRQDVLSVFSSVYSGNPSGVDVAFDFLIDNFPEISEYYNINMNPFPTIFNGLANRFTRKEQTDKLKQFIETGNLGEAKSAADNALLVALTNLEWTAKFEKEIIEYFSPTGSNTSRNIGNHQFLLVLMVTLFVFSYKLTMY